MAAPCHQTRFERVTVYVDVELAYDADTAAVLLRHIHDSAAALTQQLTVHTTGELLRDAAAGTASASAPASSRARATVELLRHWQAEEADIFTRDVHNNVPFMGDLECFVTANDTRDGAVVYALHRRQMPVLSLAAPPTAAPTSRATSAVEALLYTAVPCGATLQAKLDAISLFFTFPAECGAYVASAPSAVTNAAADASVVVVMNEDGYPVRVPTASLLLPPPPPRFAGVLRDLCVADTAQMALLRRRNPLLPGVLTAFHRYGNRGLLRSVLQRGYRVEVAESAESAVDWVRRCIELTAGGDEAETQVRCKTAAAVLANFEGTWLDMPLPQRRA
ncbi:hypothetical protein NESM_000054200 [Novymonas esmeraldas]|uniref:Uncharacterized protein n=1 Tax=Novymonas esmeraldas TaxID=1808958 RepID=A0AAW0F2H0_9TRYP